jgi:hypothetical protein
MERSVRSAKVVAMQNSIGRLLKAPCCIALFLATLHSACRAPTVLARAEVVNFQEVLDSSPKTAVAAEVVIDEDVTLRGVLVPPPLGGPLVLHLLESGGSVAKGDGGRARTLRQLADLGAGSLMLDWTGVGPSTGDASNRNILRDARVMWEAALQHVEGDESRVILRCASIGTLAAADLLQSGVRPRAVVLIAPVRAETAARNFSSQRFGRFFGGLLTFGMLPIVDVDLLSVLRSTEVPLLLLQPADGDLFVTPAESDLLAESCQRTGNTVALVDGGHLQTTLLSRGLFPMELAFLTDNMRAEFDAESRVDSILSGELAAAVPARFTDAEVRLRLERVAPLLQTEPPAQLLAAGLATSRPRNASRLLWLLQAPDGGLAECYDDLEPRELVEAWSLEDPAGELPLDLMAELLAQWQVLGDLNLIQFIYAADELAYSAQAVRAGAMGYRWSSGVTIRWIGRHRFSFDHTRLWEQLIARGLDPDDAQRQYLRILLFVYEHPHRLRIDEQGNAIIEVRAEGEWVTLDQSPPIDTRQQVRFSTRGVVLNS